MVGKIGADLQEQSQTLHNTSQVIDSATDVKIFIECNKSSNLVVSREKFQDYEDGMELVGTNKPKVKTKNEAFIIDENYMANTVGAESMQEESKEGRP